MYDSLMDALSHLFSRISFMSLSMREIEMEEQVFPEPAITYIFRDHMLALEMCWMKAKVSKKKHNAEPFFWFLLFPRARQVQNMK